MSALSLLVDHQGSDLRWLAYVTLLTGRRKPSECSAVIRNAVKVSR